MIRLYLQEELIGTRVARRAVTCIFLAGLCGSSIGFFLGIFVKRINPAAAKVIFSFCYNFAVKNPIGYASIHLVLILVSATIVAFRAFGTQKFHEKLYKRYVEPNFFNFSLMKGLCILIGAYRSKFDPLVPDVNLQIQMQEPGQLESRQNYFAPLKTICTAQNRQEASDFIIQTSDEEILQ
jgi:hypothetical protein